MDTPSCLRRHVAISKQKSRNLFERVKPVGILTSGMIQDDESSVIRIAFKSVVQCHIVFEMKIAPKRLT
jgi:hypothetical protein